MELSFSEFTFINRLLIEIYIAAKDQDAAINELSLFLLTAQLRSSAFVLSTLQLC